MANGAMAGWALALAALAVGWSAYGWRGLVLAVTIIVFWLLMQFSRSLRVLRAAANRPVGRVPSVVMLHARLAKGMALIDIVKLTHSLGTRLADEPERYAWRDDGGDELHVELQRGRLATWALHRAAGREP